MSVIYFDVLPGMASEIHPHCTHMDTFLQWGHLGYML